jgi:hypothetical protein
MVIDDDDDDDDDVDTYSSTNEPSKGLLSNILK